MPNAIHSAKPGNDWTRNDLQAYNIRVVTKDWPNFFRLATLPQSTLSKAIQTASNEEDAFTKEDRDFFWALEDTTYTLPGEEQPRVVDFVELLLRLLEYRMPKRRQMVHFGHEISLTVCGEVLAAEADLIVTQRYESGLHYRLLVKEDAEHNLADTEAQLIAAAIAAFNRQLCHKDKQPLLDACTIPGIIMSGTTSTFYKIRVTEALRHSVEYGKSPSEETVVERLDPPNPADSDGLLSLVTRKVLLQYFEAFKVFLASESEVPK